MGLTRADHCEALQSVTFTEADRCSPFVTFGLPGCVYGHLPVGSLRERFVLSSERRVLSETTAVYVFTLPIR